MGLSENCQQILCGVAVAGAVVTTASFGVGVATGVLELLAGGANLALAVRREQQDRCDRLLQDVRKRLRRDYDIWLDRECRNHPDRKAEIEDAFVGLGGVLPLIKPTTIDLVEAGLNGDRLFAAMQARLPAESPFRQQGIHRNVLKTVVINTVALVRTDAAFAAELTSLSFERVFEGLAGLDAKLDKVLVGQLELKLLAVRHHNDVMEAIAREKGVDPENLRPLFEAVGHDVPATEFEHAVRAAVAELLARSREVPQAFNDPEEIARAIAVARDKLSRLDTDGAVEHLRRARAEQAAIRHERQRGEARLAMEEADILSLAYRFDEAVAAYETAGGLDPENAWAWFKSGDVHDHRGQLGKALAAYERGKAAAEGTGDERDVSVSLERLGDVELRLGNADAALDAYRKGFAIRKALARRDPANTQWQRDLSISLDRIGDVELRLGNADAALDAYRKGFAIAEALARRDPSNTQWQRDLSISLERIGDSELRLGNADAALDAYRKGLAIREALARRDPANTEWQRDLSVSLNRIGDVERRLGNGDAALDAYRKGLAIREALALRDPANTEWQRDLSVSLNKLGDVELRLGNGDAALDAYRKGLAIREALALRDPANTEWQRDLSVSLNKLGDVERRLGNGDAALDAYRKGLAIREALALRDPANTQWQRDLSVSLNKLGDVELRLGNGDAARDAYRKGLAIREALARRDPANTEWQRDLIVSNGKLAEAGDRPADRLQAALTIAEALQNAGRLAPDDGGMIDELKRRLADAGGSAKGAA